MENIYIVKTIMSSPNHVLYSEEISDITIRTTYKFDKETRQAISAIRSRYKKPIYEGTANFHGLYLCQEQHKYELIDLMKKADKKFKDINAELQASVIFIPLDSSAIREGEMYEQINRAIKAQIFTGIFDRLQKLVLSYGQVPERSRKSLLNLVDKMSKINVLDDEEIGSLILNIRRQIETNSIEPLRKEIIKEMDILNQRGAFLEL